MGWIADLSWAHDELTGAVLAGLGASGVIGYVSDNPAKNLTRENLADHLAHGLQVGLVFEDATTDMRAGAKGGNAHGATAMGEAGDIGYDSHNCVIFAAGDENTTQDDWPTVLAYMDAFATWVPHPGYYGDQDSIDWLFPQRPHWWYWQTNATGWGTGISRNAHLVQHYADPRAQGRKLDVNDIQRPGVPFMGDDMFTDADRATLNGIASQIIAPSGLVGRLGANLLTVAKQIEDAGHTDLATQLAALRDAINEGGSPAQPGADPHALADIVADEFARRLGVTPTP